MRCDQLTAVQQVETAVEKNAAHAAILKNVILVISHVVLMTNHAAIAVNQKAKAFTQRKLIH
jgi:hypothetical protein